MKNDLLTVSILYILVIFFGLYLSENHNRKKLEKELIETKSFTIELYKEQKEYIKVLQESRDDLNSEIDTLTQQLNDKAYLDKLLKDLSRNIDR